MSVRIVQVELFEPVRPLLQRRGDPDAVRLHKFQRLRHVVDGKRNVMSARRDRVAAVSPTSLSRFGALLRCVDLHLAALEPEPWKLERRPRHLVHPQHIRVKPPRGFKIGADNRDVVKRFHIDLRCVRHGDDGFSRWA